MPFAYSLRMRFSILLALSAFSSLVPLAFAANTALIPIPHHEKVWDNKGGETWTGRHVAIKSEAAKGKAALIFIGDSITHGWEPTGKRLPIVETRSWRI